MVLNTTTDATPKPVYLTVVSSTVQSKGTVQLVVVVRGRRQWHYTIEVVYIRTPISKDKSIYHNSKRTIYMYERRS